ncbi:MAG: hypothetical protein LM517_06595 [Nitrosomonas sp.]|nr:hypothetical protein [Nitrosomonas sp.]
MRTNRTNQFLFVTVIKVCFVLFGIFPLASVILFGSLPALPQINSIVSWLGLEVVSGFVLFLGYLAVTMLFIASKNKSYFSSVKISA